MLKKKFVVGMLTALVCVSCGGASDSFTDTSGKVINPQLSGFLLVNERLNRPLKVIDLKTGFESVIPNTDWKNQTERFPSGVDQFYPIPNNYGKLEDSEIVLRVHNCEGSFSAVEDCVVVQGVDGIYKEQFEIYNRTVAPQLSPNGEFIAAYVKTGGSASNDSLQVYKRDGEWQYGLDFSRNDINDNLFQWLPDGRLFVPIGASIEIFGPYSSTGRGALSTTQYPDDFSFLRISPDGRRMLFSSGDKFLIGGTDGSGIREFVTSVDGRTLTGPSWSPNGNYILMLSGFIDNSVVFDGGAGGDLRLYAVPTDRAEVQYISADPSERSPTVIPVKRLVDGVETLRWQDNDLYWKN